MALPPPGTDGLTIVSEGPVPLRWMALVKASGQFKAVRLTSSKGFALYDEEICVHSAETLHLVVCRTLATPLKSASNICEPTGRKAVMLDQPIQSLF